MWIQAGGILFNPDIIDLVYKAGYNKENDCYEIHFMIGGYCHPLAYRREVDRNREFERILISLECSDLLQEDQNNDDDTVDPTAPDEDSEG